MRLRFACLALLIPLFAFAQNKDTSTLMLERMVVTGKRPSAAETKGPDGIRTYDESEVEASGAFSLQEFLDTLPRDNGEEQLILVNGVPTELTALTPAMIAAIEVSYTGTMPAYGAYSRGRIINIRLKEDYSGREISLQGSGSLHADAWRREATLSGGLIREPWRLTYSAEYNRQDAVTADEREFSREQDRRAPGGRDFRLPWGDSAVVQAVAGNLNGQPGPVALVPDGATSTPAPGGFLAGAGPAASGQRFFNTARYLYLASPSESLGASFNLNRAFGKLQLGFSGSHRMSRSRREGPPPVSAASAETLVPAALNPFGQDVMVGLVHTGFGPATQQSESGNTRLNVTANWTGPVRAEVGGWRISSNLSFSRSRSENDARDLNPAAFTAALASANPATRFNPFVGAGSSANAALYPSLAFHRTREQANDNTRLSLQSNGPVAPGWGAGPVRLFVNGNANWRQDETTSRNLRGVADGVTGNSDANYAANASVMAPLLKERPRFHRLGVFLGSGYSANSGGGDSRRDNVGVSWAPVRTWTFRAGFNRNISSPGESGDDDPEATVETLLDPRRTPAAAENVQVISRRSASTEPSRGDDVQLSVGYEPAARPGLQFSVDYSQSRSSRATGNPFKPQDVIDNEALLAGRVVRDTPTAADLALGQPGRILAVDTTAVAIANDERRTLNFGAEYRFSPGSGNPPPERGNPLPGAGPGQPRAAQPNRISISLNAEYPLDSRYELAAGQAFISRESGPANRPDWTAFGSVRWSSRRWNAGVRVRHSAASQLGTIPAITNVGVDISYRFETAFWGKFGKNLRLRAQVQNLGSDEPPRADTILGYRGGSPVGTMVTFSANTPW